MYTINGNTVNLDARRDYFIYKKEAYPSGTTIIYNGECFKNDSIIILNNQCVKWLFSQNGKHYFNYNNQTYTCPFWELQNKIVKIVCNPKTQINLNTEYQSQKTEIYWTNDMVAKTLWYIAIMIVAIIFRGFIGIWILATIVWYNSIFKNK